MEVKLLRRTPRLVQATDEGGAFRAQVGRILEQLDEATDTLRNARSLPSGNLRVTALLYDLGVTPVFAPMIRLEFGRALSWASRWKWCWTEAVPRFRVALRSTLRSVLPARSTTRRRSSHSDWDLFCYLGIYAAPTYLEKHGAPARPEDLARHRLALIRAPGGTALLSMWKAGEGGKKRVELRVRASLAASDHAFCREAALGGFAIAPMPSMLAAPDLESGRLVRVLEPYVLGEAGVYFVYLGSRLLQPKIRAFRDFMLERYGVAPARGRKRD